jgi:hypothetical protein
MIVPLEVAKDIVFLCDRIVGAMSQPLDLTDVGLTRDTLLLQCLELRAVSFVY